MQVSVRYVPFKKLPNRPAICIDADKKYVDCVISDSGRIRSFKLSLREFATKTRYIPHRGGIYQPLDMLKNYIELSERKPCTRAAKTLLESIDPLAKNLKVETGELETKKQKTRGKAILRLATRFKVEPRIIRKALRKEGLNAPYYDDEPTVKLLQRLLGNDRGLTSNGKAASSGRDDSAKVGGLPAKAKAASPRNDGHRRAGSTGK